MTTEIFSFYLFDGAKKTYELLHSQKGRLIIQQYKL